MGHRIVFMGTPAFAVSSLRALVAAGQDVVGVLTQPDRRQGRGRHVSPPPVKEAALELGLTVHQPEKLRTGETFELVAQMQPEFLVVVAYGKILGAKFLALPSIAPINVHASLLPKYRGAAPIHWSIVRGERETGVGIMRMEEGLDTGPVYVSRAIPITPVDTMGSMHDKLAELGAALLMEALPQIAAGLVPVPQAGQGGSYAPTLSKADGALHFDEPAKRVADRVRGMFPWPGAYCRLRGRLLKIHEAVPLEASSATAQVGAIVAVTEDGVHVACAQGTLVVRALQFEGKARQDAAEFVRGYRLALGERLEADERVAQRRD